MADDVLVEQDTLDTITTRNQLNGGIPILDPNGKIYEHYLPNGGSGSANDVTYDNTNSLLKYNNGGSTISSPKFTDGVYTPAMIGTESNGSVRLKPSSADETGELVVTYNTSGTGSVNLGLNSDVDTLKLNATNIELNTTGNLSINAEDTTDYNAYLRLMGDNIAVNTNSFNINNTGNFTYYTTFGNIDFSTEGGELTLNGNTSTSVSGYSSLILRSESGSVDIKAYDQVSFGVGNSTAMLIDTQTSNVNIGGILSLGGDKIRMKGTSDTTWDITIDSNGNLITTQVIS